MVDAIPPGFVNTFRLFCVVFLRVLEERQDFGGAQGPVVNAELVDLSIQVRIAILRLAQVIQGGIAQAGRIECHGCVRSDGNAINV